MIQIYFFSQKLVEGIKPLLFEGKMKTIIVGDEVTLISPHFCPSFTKVFYDIQKYSLKQDHNHYL